jgi:hypothetical protein
MPLKKLASIPKIYCPKAGQTHLNLLGFSINNHYSIQRPVFFLSHSSFSIVPA